MVSRFMFLSIGSIVIAAMSGCNQNSKPTKQTNDGVSSVPKTPVKIVVFDDRPLSQAISREWSANTGAEVICRDASIKALDQVKSDADVFVFPSSYLGELTSKQIIRPLPKNSTQLFELTDFLPLSRTHEMRWAKNLYALSIGSPQLVLIYRSDVFEKLNLDAPKTWEDYETACSTILAAQDGLSEYLNQQHMITAEPLAEGWGAKTVLARAASYARNQNEYSCLFSIRDLQPLIDMPPFVRALDELRASFKYMPDDVDTMSPHAIATKFAEKQLAMAVTWPSASSIHRSTAESIACDFAVLPGAKQAFGFSENLWHHRAGVVSVPLLGVSGRLVAISKSTRNFRASTNFMAWLCATEQGTRVPNRSQATTPFRFSQAGQASMWMERAFSKRGKKYFETILQNQSQPICLMLPNFLGSQRYLKALDEAVRASLRSQATSKEVLESVARQWDRISDELGRESQTKEYSRSLGIAGI